MKLRIVKYIVAWFALNAALSMLWVALNTGPDVAFILGILHGGISQVGLAYLFMERQRT